jgi:hypothetical protein
MSTQVSNVVEVSKTELMNVLMNIKGSTPATITAVTDVKMNKGRGENTNPYLDRLFKKQVSNVFINFSYTNAVNKRLVKEGKEATFEAKERAWGDRVMNPDTGKQTPLITHNGAFYLEAGFITKNSPKVEYQLDGEPVEDTALFENWLPKTNTSSRQGLSDENEVVLRTFKLDSVREVKVNGTTYVVR